MSTPATCTRCESPVESGDLRCAICAQVVVRAARTDAPRQLVRILRCDGCGAALEWDASAAATRCAFCGATLHLEEREDPLERAEEFLPFTVDEAAARRALREWLGGLGFFRPGRLRDEASVEKLRALYWPAWLFDAEALVSWTADSNAGARKAAWAPHAGQTSMVFDDVLVPATRGLTHEEAAFVASGCRVDSADGGPSGARAPDVEPFETPRSQARQRILAAVDRVARRRVVDECLPGTKHRHLHAALLLRRLVTRRLAFPAWVVSWRWKNQVHRTVICGQDAALVRGTAPVSWAKVALVVAAAVGALAGLAALFAAFS